MLTSEEGGTPVSALQTIYQPGQLQFTSLAFLFVVLPVFLLAYYLLPTRFRPGVLLVESLLLCWMVQRPYLGIIAFVVVTDYAILRLLVRLDDRPRGRKWCMGASAAKALAVILWMGGLSQIQSLPQALGVQVCVLSALSCVWDVYRGEIPPPRGPLPFVLYCIFFPRLPTGPLLPYGDFAAQLDKVTLQVGKVFIASGVFIQGALKTAVIGAELFTLYGTLATLDGVTALSAWCQVFTLAFSLYFMLSGYSDMARGLAGMFGITLPANFYYPYQSRSVTDFFDRFNISVGRFLYTTVYRSLGEEGGGPLSHSLNLLTVGMLGGLWFGVRLSYLVWGLYLAAFVVMERYLYPKVMERAPTLLGRVMTLGVVLSSFTIFSGDSLTESVQLIRHMFQLNNLVDQQILYLLSSHWLLLIISCVFATNAVDLITVKFRRAAPQLAAAVMAVINCGVLVAYLMLMM